MHHIILHRAHGAPIWRTSLKFQQLFYQSSGHFNLSIQIECSMERKLNQNDYYNRITDVHAILRKASNLRFRHIIHVLLAQNRPPNRENVPG